MQRQLSVMVLLVGVGAAVRADAQECDSFNFPLDPGQVAPQPGGAGHGWSVLLVNGTTLRGHFYVETGETVTAVHLHGPAGFQANGPVLMDLPLPTDTTATLELPGVVTDDRHTWFCQGQAYIDIHTVQHPGGAFRGQVLVDVGVTASTWSAVRILFR